MSASPRRLVLASTSPYRRELLQRLGMPFEVVGPHIDESPLPGETPVALSLRLAQAKAEAVSARYPDALIIGSDQVAYAAGRIYGKSVTRERAIEQLRSLRGRSVVFQTALCLLDAASGRAQLEGVPVEVRFRDFSDDEIERYLDREPAFDCAGSARYEGLGISLIEAVRGDDPNALIGLPLIALCRMLRRAGVPVP
jgi:septum formation protein